MFQVSDSETFIAFGALTFGPGLRCGLDLRKTKKGKGLSGSAEFFSSAQNEAVRN
jgi:hypothetical protein